MSAGKETRWRKLLAVADDYNLFAASNRAKSVNRLNLAGLVNHEQIKLHGASFRIRDGKWTHHKHRLDRLHYRARIFEKSTNSPMAALAFHFTLQNASGTDACIELRHVFEMSKEGAIFS